ncbi:TetR/AcrR family transcriptional regulator [Streptomyces sp. HPF1205]|uniref:TetR/AcrR family transcriptional regulator n=1 Tax=Streptomyces sp. HPF1205 TaxID=2873262 RepID=UPI001CEC8BF9|nr:TetR/AcrR family transcriptional regulator [Streptomyces sp. HPF1205]
MPTESARARSTSETRDRILDVALDVLGDDPEAAMGDIASAAGVVRRTVYGHFPSRLDLVRTLTERAVAEVTAVLTEVNASDAEADATWAEFVARLWPVAHRYRVLLALRRGEYGEAIHGLLGPVDELLAGLVKRGQDNDVFAQHLPAGILSQLAYGAVFAIADSAIADSAIADSDRSNGTVGARAATITSLLMLGVPEARAIALVGDRP